MKFSICPPTTGTLTFTRLHVSVFTICRSPRPQLLHQPGQPVAKKAERRGHDHGAGGIHGQRAHDTGRRHRAPAYSPRNPDFATTAQSKSKSPHGFDARPVRWTLVAPGA